VARLFTLVGAAVIGTIVVYFVIAEPRHDDFLLGTIAVTSLLTGCGLVIALAMSMMAKVRHVGMGETVSSKVVIELTCPRCASPQLLRAGLSRCGQCGLRLEINVEEPVCLCGYQLYQLTGEKCPECGREIPKSDRWAGQAPVTSSVSQGDGSAHVTS
jgi:hypothetical protein